MGNNQENRKTTSLPGVGVEVFALIDCVVSVAAKRGQAPQRGQQIIPADNDRRDVIQG